jgi:hypothetical protein
VDLVIHADQAQIQYRRYERSSTTPTATNLVCQPAAARLEADLRSLGLFELRSVSEQMFDGSLAVIAARDSTHRHLFKENSIDTPQAQLCTFLLKLARPADQDDTVA